ncbi:hypothetical protein N665_0070s0003 [Sinapis alba]|nr:hypothetical protein N665_0070s0003 [Sinapis alba]
MAQRKLIVHENNGYERSDIPILGQSCRGDNPYLRMALANFDKECKVCTRPFKVFRWRPGWAARYKNTEICQTCSKLKNYGLPFQVRDMALNITTLDSIPRSHVNREYFAEELGRMTRSGLDYESSFRKMRANDTLLNLQRTEPDYEKKQPNVCSFNTIGKCTRGAGCAFRHEMAKTGELSHQNKIFENDPVAMKLLRKAGEMSTLEPPEDESIKTLYISGLNSRTIVEQDIHDQFCANGEIQSIIILAEKACAFVLLI